MTAVDAFLYRLIDCCRVIFYLLFIFFFSLDFVGYVEEGEGGGVMGVGSDTSTIVGATLKDII